MNNFQNQWEPGDPPEIDGPKKMNNHKTQAERILRLLETYNGDWVPAFLLPRISLSYTRRIFELRKTHKIEIRYQWVEGQKRTAYRLIKNNLTPRADAK